MLLTDDPVVQPSVTVGYAGYGDSGNVYGGVSFAYSF